MPKGTTCAGPSLDSAKVKSLSKLGSGRGLAVENVSQTSSVAHSVSKPDSIASIDKAKQLLKPDNFTDVDSVCVAEEGHMVRTDADVNSLSLVTRPNDLQLVPLFRRNVSFLGMKPDVMFTDNFGDRERADHDHSADQHRQQSWQRSISFDAASSQAVAAHKNCLTVDSHQGGVEANYQFKVIKFFLI
jgi:hypothetical protein